MFVRRKIVRAIAPLSMAIALTACNDALTSTAPPVTDRVPKVITMEAVSDTVFEAEAGAGGPDISVIVRDSARGLITGAVVRFTLTIPSGLQMNDSVTSIAGSAVFKGWKTGAIAGTNTVIARAGDAAPLSFRIVTSAGPPT